MYIQILSIFIFGYSTILTCMFITFACLVLLDKPILSVVRKTTAAPATMFFGMFSNVIIPTISRTKTRIIFHFIAILGITHKRFSTIRASFINSRLTWRMMTTKIFLSRFTSYLDNIWSIANILHQFNHTFMRTCFLKIATTKVKLLATNWTYPKCLGLLRPPFFMTRIRTKFPPIDSSWGNFMNKMFTTLNTICFNFHVIKKEPAFDLPHCCLSIANQKQARFDNYAMLRQGALYHA